MRELNKRASELRITHLEDQIRHLEDQDDGKAAKIRDRILKAEAIKAMYKKLRSYLKPQTHNRLSHIKVPDNGRPPKQSTSWTDLHEPVAIENTLLQHNERHFGQADGPFTRGTLGDIPFCGSGELADNILHGHSHNLSELMQTFLSAMHRPSSVKDIPNNLTMQEVIGKFENWKESTSTSPITKRHLGHYHCLLRLMGQEQPDTETDVSVTQAKTIFGAHYSILAYTVKHGKSLKWWQHVVNSMIEKEPGNTKIHCLRVIHLCEAD